MLLFFCQAEDGIRDATVTGVQTCALPIMIRRPPRSTLFPYRALDLGGRRIIRSEERRVGKECRSRGSPYHYKKKETRSSQIPRPNGARVRQAATPPPADPS